MCPTGVPADHCIPMCEAKTNGYLLLLNLDGEDTKLTCELHHGLYSWVGGSADGGFIGTDPKALFSAIVSGAAGTYVGTLAVDANISTALTIHRGQIVQIAGDRALSARPAWGSGGFVIVEGGSLTLEFVAFLAGKNAHGTAAVVLTVLTGGRLSVADSLLMQPAAAVAEWIQPVPLPCDGGPDGLCRGPHSGAVVLDAAATVSLAVPLVCTFWTEDCRPAVPAGVTTEQHTAGMAAGIPWNADAVCFLHGVAGTAEERQTLEDKERVGSLTAAEAARLQTMRASVVVPDDPNFLVSAGVGIESSPFHERVSSYDPSMPPALRCDAAEHVAGCHGPFGLNRSGTRWYRLPTGKGLPIAPPDAYHCGTGNTGWLSDWPAGAEGQPYESYSTPADGSLPPSVGSPPAAGTMCFDTTGYLDFNPAPGPGYVEKCTTSTVVRAVSCGAFALWALPPVPLSVSGYCLTPDPCADCASAGRCAAESWSGNVGGGSDPANGDGHCACAMGWGGALCDNSVPPPVAGMPPGVSREQHDRAVAAGVDPAADPVCFTAAFVTVPDDPNLLVSAGQGATARDYHYDPSMPPNMRCDSIGPFGLLQGGTDDEADGTRWYRLPAGKGLPTTPLGQWHCGTRFTGWLSGWPAAAEGQPNNSYAITADGSLPPPVGSPPAAGTVCFSGDVTCYYPTPVRAVSCGAFALWQLPPTRSCHVGVPGGAGYCLAPDPCADCAASGRCIVQSWGGRPFGGICANDDSTTDGTNTCSSYYDDHPEDCDHYNDAKFTAALQCCACGGGDRDLVSGHCTCNDGWAGTLCDQRVSG